jgi:hypothetical protein
MKISWARTVLALAIVLLASSRPAWCEGGLDADAMKRYGGTYLSDCKNPASPRVTVFENALVFIQGDKRIAAQTNVQNAPSYFGQSPPENFDTLLMGEIPGGETLMLMVYADGNDLSIKLDGDAALRTKIGKPALALTYRRCDAKGASAAPAPATAPARPRPVTAATPDAELPDAGGMILDPGFKAAYFKALGRFKNEPWLATLDGPARDTKRVTVAGSKYLLTGSCKNHDCAENNVTILYSPEKKLVYGKIRMSGKSALIGSPPPAVAKELGEFWRKAWGPTP